MNTVQISPALVEKFAQALAGLSPEQLDSLLQDRARLKIALVANRATSSAPRAEVDLDGCAAKLRLLTDRAAGCELLASLNKPTLRALAKKFDLSVDSSATKDKLIDRIVERVIGLKLRQDAFAQLR
jgi:hypothetical protein